MSNYHPVYVDIWNDSDFSEYKPLEQLVFLFLITNERCKLSGIYKITLKQIAFSVNSDLKKIKEIVSKFPDKQVMYDFDNAVVFICNYFKYNLNKIGNPKTIAGTLLRNNKLVPHNFFWDLFFNKYEKITDRLNQRIKDDNYLILRSNFQCEISLESDFNKDKDINNNKNKDLNTKIDLKKISVEKEEKIIFNEEKKIFENITDGKLELWTDAYPAIDLDSEINKAASWLLENPKNKKSNYGRFLTNWLSRAQDKARRLQNV